LIRKHLESLQGLCKDYVVFVQGFDKASLTMHLQGVYGEITKFLRGLQGSYKASTKLVYNASQGFVFCFARCLRRSQGFFLDLPVALLWGHLRALLDCFFALAALHALGSTRSTRLHLPTELLGSADALRFFRLRRRTRLI
jgi:hypothetical protein